MAACLSSVPHAGPVCPSRAPHVPMTQEQRTQRAGARGPCGVTAGTSMFGVSSPTVCAAHCWPVTC